MTARLRTTGTLLVLLLACLALWPDARLVAQQAFNLIQVNGTALLTGNGVTGTGSPRVTIASDNTAFTVNAAQSGTWTVQPGNTANTTPWLFAIDQTGNNNAVDVLTLPSVTVGTSAGARGTASIIPESEAISSATRR